MAHQPFESVFDQQAQRSGGVRGAFPSHPASYGLTSRTSQQPQRAALLRAPSEPAPRGDPQPQQTGLEGVLPELLKRVASLEARVQQLEVACGEYPHGSSSDRGVGLKIIESPYMSDGEMP